MTTKSFIILMISIFPALIACQTDNPENTDSQDNTTGTVLPASLPEPLQNSDEAIIQRNETLDLECLSPLESPAYDQLHEEAAMVIPSENYELRLLAWDSRVDDRPHYLDSVLLWAKQLSNGEDSSWFLIDMARLPQSYDPSWRLHEATDGGWGGFQEFLVPPVRNDVYYFTALPSYGYAPRFAPEYGFKFIKANVCEQTWRETIGGAPPHYVGVE